MRVYGLGFRLYCLGLRVQGLGFTDEGNTVIPVKHIRKTVA